MNPFQAAPDNKKRLTLIGIYVAMVGSIMASSGISTLLPAAALEIGGMEYYPLANTIAGILGINLMPLYGYLGARNPALKRKLFSASMIGGALVIFARALAQSMMGIIVPNVFWGIVAAAIYVLGYSMIRDMYDAKQAGIYLGAIGTMMSIGMLAGPAITGLLIDNFSWRIVCHVTWPFLVIAGILVYMGARATTEEAKPLAMPMGAFDFAGAAALMGFLTALILVLSLGSNFIPFGSTASNILLAVAAVSLIALFFIIRKKQSKAIIPAPVLKDRNTLCLAFCNLMLNFSSMAVFFFMPTYVLYVMGRTATQASLTTTILALAGLFLSPILGKMIAKEGNARTVLAGGTIIRIVITACFLLFLTPNTPLWVVYILMLFAGIYNSQQGVTFATAPQIQIKPQLRMMSNSVIQVSQNFGSAMGLSVYTLVIGIFGVSEGMRVAFMLAITAAALALAASLMLKKLDSE